MPWESAGYEKLVQTFQYITEVESILIKITKYRQTKLQHIRFNICSFLQSWVKESSNSVSPPSLILWAQLNLLWEDETFLNATVLKTLR